MYICIYIYNVHNTIVIDRQRENSNYISEVFKNPARAELARLPRTYNDNKYDSNLNNL